MNEPIHIISLGAGVQSSTMALMAAKGEITPMPKCAIFADTQAECADLYKHLDWLESELPFPVHRVTAGSLESDSIRVVHSQKTKGNIYMKGGIPAFVKQENGNKGLLGRKCTTDFKVVPLLRHLRTLCDWKRGEKRMLVTLWMGISSDEAIRMKDSREAWVEKIYPLVDLNISRNDCLKWLKKNGYPEPPKSSCRGCPFHSDDEWLRIKSANPIDFAAAISWEKQLQEAARSQNVLKGIPFLHSSCVPLETISFEKEKPGYAQLDMFGNDCEGLCGV